MKSAKLFSWQTTHVKYNHGMVKNCIEYAMAVVMALGLIGGFFNRWHKKRGIGERFNQYIVFTLVIPATVILAFEKLIGPETSAAILGVSIGFAAAVAGRDPSPKSKQRPSQAQASNSSGSQT